MAKQAGYKMNKFIFRRDLGLQILALYGLYVGLIFAAFLFFAAVAQRRLEADVQAADLALAQAIGQETSSALENALNSVRQLALYDSVAESDRDGMLLLFGTVMQVRNDVNLVYRLDRDGVMLFHYPVGPDSTVGVDFSFRDYFQRARGSAGPVVSYGRISPTTQQPVATAVMPVRRDGEFLGVIGTNLKLQSLSHSIANIVKEYPTSEQLEIMILDAKGQIIAHPDPAMLLVDGNEQMPDVVRDVLSGKRGHLIVGSGDAERLVSYVPMPAVGWGVVVSRPTAVAFATPNAIRRGVYWGTALFLLGGVIFWMLLSRRVIQPIERVTLFSQAIGQSHAPLETHGHVVLPLANRPDQIGYLTKSMIRMQQDIEARLNELSTLLDTSTAVVSTLDLQNVLDRILEQVERLLHTPMCAIFALDKEQELFRVQASRGLSEWYATHAVIHPNEPTSVTMRAIRSGQPVQISDTETNPSFVAHRPRARLAGYRSVLAAPLNTHHAPPSALLIFRPDPHEFTEQETALVASFANHAAMAIENATLFARSDMALQEQTRRLEALIQSMQDGIILEDVEGRLLYTNRRMAALCERCGVVVSPLSGQPVAELMRAITVNALDQEAVLAEIETAVAAQGDRHVEFAVQSTPTHREYWRLRIFDVMDRQQTPIGRGRILRDVTKRRELDRMKSNLIATVSHELRTPLAAIKGYTSTLLAEDVAWDAASQRDFLQIISDETDHLSQLVSDLLDMSRIEAGNLQVSRTLCDFVELVEQASHHAHPSPGARLVVDVPPDLPPLFADPQRIEVVLRNLLENAAKYGGESSRVFVQARVENGRFLISVSDEGPGIAVGDEHLIFDSFYRGDDGLTRQTTGAGLGLAIARGFVQAHGGEIWVTPLAKGTCFTFSLPLQPEFEDEL